MSLQDPLAVTLSGPAADSYPVYFHPIVRLPRLMLDHHLRLGTCLVVTDERVAVHYIDLLMEAMQSCGWRPAVFRVPSGERSKSSQMLQSILDWALEHGIDRKTPLVAFGGGVVGDLAGFAASILLRGLPLVQAPTTLVAQVDSSIGGKTGINHETGKNLIGAFYPPRLVCADAGLLLTLAERDWVSGLAETVKHALIADKSLLADIQKSWKSVLARDLAIAAPLIARSAGVKVGIVSEDEKEAGIRALLNFGHTFGHAIEKTTGYGVFTHGEAVTAGMSAALTLSELLKPSLDLSQAREIVGGLPIEPPLTGLSAEQLTEAMWTDKKREGGKLRFVVLEELGRGAIADKVTPDQIERAWRSILG